MDTGTSATGLQREIYSELLRHLSLTSSGVFVQEILYWIVQYAAKASRIYTMFEIDIVKYTKFDFKDDFKY